MRRFVFGLVGVAVVAGIAWLAFRDAIVMRLVGRVAARNMQTDLLQDLPDGLHVGLCGAGSPLPDPKRSGPCVFVVAGGRLFVVDAGSGSSRVLARMRVPQGAIEAVLLTHLHSDHIDGLGEVEMQRWAMGGHDTPLPVLGPEGVEDVVAGIDLAYRASRGYRVAHHGADIVPPSGAGAVARPFASPPVGEAVTLIDDGGLVVRAFRVDHTPVDPAVGYRFDYGGRSVAISGDTKKSANVVRFARGVDLLVHEALSARLVGVLTEAAERADRPRLAKITRDIVDYHTTPVEAAEVAQEAGARRLLLDHIVPPLPLGAMEPLFLEGVHDVYEGPVTLGRDGTFVRMDVGDDRIVVSDLL